ncbi:MAG TPA: helix-turn-helix domain-containing protein [Candidatus Limnocylindria bacterium]|nr:helix-turn-helix domain-containing protein [Candidatus Limnocylindria bacterium]
MMKSWLHELVPETPSATTPDLDARQDLERRRRLAAFLLGKRQAVDARAKQVGPYVRRDNRVGRSFTQEEVAEALDVSRQWYAALEMGSSIRPSMALLDRIATLYGLPESERVQLFRLAIREFAVALKAAHPMLDGEAPPTAYASAIRSVAQIDVAAYELARIRDGFHLAGAVEGFARPRIVESWQRCRELGVNPNQKKARIHEDVPLLRAANERFLRAADPVLVHLADELSGTGYVIVICDANGYVLELAGDLSMRRSFSRLEFEAGGDWSEKGAGTNAIGTAIVDRRPLQMLGGEHFCDASVPYTCTAAPIYAPMPRELIGVLDISGSYKLVRPHLVGVVMQAALEIEERLALL